MIFIFCPEYDVKLLGCPTSAIYAGRFDVKKSIRSVKKAATNKSLMNVIRNDPLPN